MEDRGAVVDRWVAAVRAHDWQRLRDLYHPDAVQEFPQTGERAVGIDNIIAVVENFPALPTTDLRRTSGVGDQFVLDAMFQPRQVRGRGDIWCVEATSDYGEDGIFELASILEFRGDRISRETAYFAPRSDPPAWRSQWMERTR